MLQEVAATQTAEIPEFRLTKENHHVFQTTGLDFVGPFPVKENGRNRPRYILLFTCIVVRAVHLEVAVDLTTDSIINCILRFVSRRGKPKSYFPIVENLLLDQITLCNPVLQALEIPKNLQVICI